MTKIVKLRVLLDFEEDVFRDIEVATSNSFQDLHNMVQEAFGFDNSQMASFYMSNEDWEKGQEITLMDMGQAEEPIPLMSSVSVGDMIEHQGQKLLYVFDFFLMWCFYIDVISVTENTDNIILPRIVQSFGDAPEQYSKSADLTFDFESTAPSDDKEEPSMEEELQAMFSVVGTEFDAEEGHSF